ncbi:unnamed protein product [Heterobilharzia americana]|nr:unnamed protein product [Heterobilharzia americana]
MQFSGLNRLLISYWNLNQAQRIIYLLLNLILFNVEECTGLGYNVATKYNRPQFRWRRSLTPCSWLERGGFFNMPKYYNSLSPFVQRRHICSGHTTCPLNWLPTNDVRSLTFKLIGTDDMRDYEFQAHFVIESMKHDIVTVQMKKVKLHLNLDKLVHGLCKGVQFGDRVFRGNYIHMTCATKPQCKIDDFCYIETPSTDGYIYGGRVPCICPKQYHCPIYFIRDKRIPQVNDDGRVISYGVKCKRRIY